MAQQQPTLATGSSILDTVPLFVVVLLAAHVLALVYWMYKLASDKQPPRRKTQ
uniref:Transmembrane protein n=1 Tax=Arundo donax TaxID=35708 RepID=A0A0A9GKR4_ARUDO